MTKEVFEDQSIVVEDGESWGGSGNSGLGIQGIALEQFRRCVFEGSQIMSVEQFDKWINCVDALDDVIFPFLDREKEIKAQLEDVEGKIKSVKESLNQELNEKLQRTNEIEKTWMAYYKVKQDKLMQLYRIKFRCLSNLINKENYFGEESAMF